MRPSPAVLLALLACNPGDDEVTTCEQFCEELVMTCEYAAFPDFESCQKGCLFDEENGVNVRAELKCVQDAACDTFAILECDHAHEAEAPTGGD